jgi:acyl-CoA synthetase (NDP forming)
VRKLGEGLYAIKLISQQLIHKSDSKALRLGLTDTASIDHAWNEMEAHVVQKNKEVTIDGALVQRMVGGVECIIGMKRDAVFGPVILFGLGGIFVEIVKDTAMRIAPITKEQALAQIRSIQGFPLLAGARGRDAVDIDALAHVVTSLSHLVLDYPEITEIDLNPVFATSKGVEIVDVRVMRMRE